MAPSIELSIVIPTFNEKDNLEELTDRLHQALAETEHEIIIVDDNSPDGTYEEAERIRVETDRNVRPVLRKEDSGLAKSVKKGFKEARGDSIVVMDADLQHPPEKVAEIYDKLSENTPLVVGTRYTGNGDIEGWTFFRKTVSKGANLLSKAFVPEARKTSDPVSGFFGVKRDRVNPEELSPHGYKILLETLSQVRPEKVGEVGYVFEEREKGESKLGVQQYIKFLEHAAECRIKHHRFHEKINPRKSIRFLEFAAVGATGVAVNTVIFMASTTASLHYLLAGALAFGGAVQWNFFWNWFLTFNQPSEQIREKYLKFNAVSLGGFLIYEAALLVLIGVLGQPRLTANLLAIMTSFFWNFTGSEKIAFEMS